jgi:hypothetical protein
MNFVVGAAALVVTSFIAYKLLKPIASQALDEMCRETEKKSTKPKKKVNPYFAFCKEKRPEIVTSNPELKPREIVKKLGEEWGKLSDKEKDEYRT